MDFYEHTCPKCKQACFYDREGHRCQMCKNVHMAKLERVTYPEGWNAPNTEPVMDTEMQACLIVAEMHCYQLQGFYYHASHFGDDGGLHLICQFRNMGFELQEIPGTRSLAEHWQRELDKLNEGAPNWYTDLKGGPWRKAYLRQMHDAA